MENKKVDLTLSLTPVELNSLTIQAETLGLSTQGLVSVMVRNSISKVHTLGNVNNGEYVYDSYSVAVTYNKDMNVKLTNKENLILEYLVSNKGEVCKTQDIMDYVWGKANTPSIFTFRNIIMKLRAKVGHNNIVNKSGHGYYVVIKTK